MKIIFTTILLFVLLTSACPAQKSEPVRTPENTKPENSKPENSAAKQTAALEKQIAEIAALAKARVGVKAELLETGESVALNPGEQFPMQSVYKLPIGMAVLREVDAGKIKLDQKIRVEKSDFVERNMLSPLRDNNPNGAEVTVGELLRLAVSVSDGTASDVLLKLAGGPAAVQSFLGEIKVGEVMVINPEKDFPNDWQTQYRNWASPAGAVKLLRAVQEKRGLSAESNALLVKLLTETKTKPQRLKGLLPKDAVVAHKTGSSGSRNGVTAATNDIGIITLPDGRHLAIAVFVSDSPADEKTREAVIAKIARAAWDYWSK
jgi:beta-lactamase class A